MTESSILTAICIILSLSTLALAITTHTYSFPYNTNPPDNLYYNAGYDLGILNVGSTVNITFLYDSLSTSFALRKFS